MVRNKNAAEVQSAAVSRNTLGTSQHEINYIKAAEEGGGETNAR